MKREETKLVLGRGEVFFDRFVPGTRVGEGELYLGNTPSFQVQRDVERVSRRQSYRGKVVDREGAVISESHVVNFTTDHISMDNVGLWFGSEAETVDEVSQSVQVETLVVRQGRFYQLGKTFVPVIGLRNVDYVRVRIGGVLVPMAGNYDLENEVGRIQILKGAPNIPDGATITVAFEWRNAVVEKTVAEPEEVYGAMRFISQNPYGFLKHFIFPMVRIAPRGLVDLKGDEFQQWQFTATAMNLSPSFKQVYVNESLSAGYTADEQAIITEFGSFSDFIDLESELHQIQNYEWPPALDFQGV